jgi:hypothetical protein
MKFVAKLFWPLLPVALLVGTYREANSTVLRYWAFSRDRDAVSDTFKDLQKIITTVAINYKVTQTLPHDLKDFLEQQPVLIPGSRTRPLNVDAWLTPYQLHDLGDRYEVVSCGPDRNCDDPIDNLVEGAKKVKNGAADPGGDPRMKTLMKNVNEMNKNVDEYNKNLEQAK